MFPGGIVAWDGLTVATNGSNYSRMDQVKFVEDSL